jgi:ribonuclease-3
MSAEMLEELEKKLGLTFKDIGLLELALIHRSYLNEQDNVTESNERLEFLGDAVLSLVVADYLYKTYPDQSEGSLTNLRSALVRRETLCKWALEFGLGDYLLLGKGEANSGGRTRPAILAGTFEALLGALFMEGELAATYNWLLPLIKAELEEIFSENRHLNFKTRLQIEAQRRFHVAPVYALVGQTGLEHERIFEIEVRIADQPFGRGNGTTKQLAQQEAARLTLETLSTLPEAIEPA